MAESSRHRIAKPLKTSTRSLLRYAKRVSNTIPTIIYVYCFLFLVTRYVRRLNLDDFETWRLGNLGLGIMSTFDVFFIKLFCCLSHLVDDDDLVVDAFFKADKGSPNICFCLAFTSSNFWRSYST